MPTSRHTEPFFRESRVKPEYLLIGILCRVLRVKTGESQASMARKFGMSLKEYQHIEEAVHAPDSEKTLKLVKGGLMFSPYDARTRVSAEVVDLLLPRGEAIE